MFNKKLLVLTILTIFCIGMVMGTASASHTFKSGKYKITISDKQYNKLKKATKDGSYYVTKKTGEYKTYKVPKYKTKKVTKHKWKYKKVVVEKTVYSSDFMDCTNYDYNYKHNKYVKNGWKYYGYSIVKSKDGRTVKVIDKFKKKVKVTEKKKVKVGYTTKKTPIKIDIVADIMNGAYLRVYAEWYNNGYHLKTYSIKDLNI